MCTPVRAVVVLLSVWVVVFCGYQGTLVEALNTTAFYFSFFPADNTSSILTVEDASYNSVLHSYDMNSGSTPGVVFTSLNETCGRVMHKDRVQLVDKVSGEAASFNTSFTFSLERGPADSARYGGQCGEGMIFTFVADPKFTGDVQRSEAFCTYNTRVGLQNSAVKNSRVFAVKFDSYFGDFASGTSFNESSDSSIGIIITNKAGKTTTLQYYNLCEPNTTNCQFFCGSQYFTAWIDYDSAAQMLEVRIRNGTLNAGGKPAEALLKASNLSLGEVLDDEMYVGFTAKTPYSPGYSLPSIDRSPNTIHRISSWYFNSSGIAHNSSSVPSPSVLGVSKPEFKLQAGVIAGICAAVLGSLLMGIFLFFLFKRRNQRPSENPKPSTTLDFIDTTSSRAFNFKELCSITKNFNDNELLSSGAFGDVYKGTLLSGSKSMVAVKRIKPSKDGGEESFFAEANSLRQIRHRNLLQLRGWCQAKEGLFLVYDFMSNSSLDKWLHPKPNPNPNQAAVFEGLPWNVRRLILAGVASGMEYLHEDWVQCVLHRDIKSSNVMLDADFNPYLGDFGLARLVDHQKMKKTTLLAGTLGYMAPEMIHTGRATKETDVYAFGILVLEVVCGKRPLEIQGMEPRDYVLLDRVWRAHEAGSISTIVDAQLDWQPDIGNILHLGLLCCLPNPSERPSMREVNHWFQSSEAGAMELPPLPATKPGSHGQYHNFMPQSSEGTSSSQTSSGATRGSFVA